MSTLFSCISKQNHDRRNSGNAPGTSKNLDKNESAPAQKSDPRIPLTPRQIFLLIRNWKGISRKMEQAGVTMFARMFEKDPDLYDIFTKLQHLRGTGKDELLNNELFEEHATAVMNVFDEAITKLENPDDFFRVLKEYALMHTLKPGFKPEDFWRMEEPFLYAVKLTLDDRYTDNMDTIYKAIIHLILESMVKEAEKSLANGPA